jgi:hypothetical protein
MSTKELREKATKAIEALPDKALEKLIALMEELKIASEQDNEADDALIEQIISENRDVLARLAK